MNRLVFLAFAFTAASACAAQVDRVIVRQQWPWHEGIQVEYVLSGMSGPVDIGVSVTSRLVEAEDHIEVVVSIPTGINISSIDSDHPEGYN